MLSFSQGYTHNILALLSFSSLLPGRADAFITSTGLLASSFLFIFPLFFFYRRNEDLFLHSHPHCCCLGWWDQLLLQLSQPSCSFALILVFLKPNFFLSWKDTESDTMTIERLRDELKVRVLICNVNLRSLEIIGRDVRVCSWALRKKELKWNI